MMVSDDPEVCALRRMLSPYRVLLHCQALCAPWEQTLKSAHAPLTRIALIMLSQYQGIFKSHIWSIFSLIYILQLRTPCQHHFNIFPLKHVNSYIMSKESNSPQICLTWRFLIRIESTQNYIYIYLISERHSLCHVTLRTFSFHPIRVKMSSF